MQTLSDIRQLLESRGLSPNKALGQNFLCDHNLIRRLVDESGVRAADVILEVGPGTGALTDELVARGCNVVACELDRGLAALIRERFGPRVTLIEGDCLGGKGELNPGIIAALGGRPFRLLANLPYGAASHLMADLAVRFAARAQRSRGGGETGDAVCLGQIVTIQREVASRLRASPGTADYGELGVLVQAMCEMRRIAVLPPECFWPRPKVTSEMVAIVPRATPLTADAARLSRACRVLFGQRRKQIGAILGREMVERLGQPPEGIPLTARAEALAIEELERVAAWMEGAA